MSNPLPPFDGHVWARLDETGPACISDAALLNEYDREEWRLIARQLRPDWTDTQFNAAWADFVAMKARKTQQ